MSKLCFLDMDGVIADFVGSCCTAHGLETPYGKQNNLGIFEIENCWGMTEEKFWEPLATFDFWAKMDKTPEADELVAYLTRVFGEENICILTNPSPYDGCIGAKKAWVAENYPQFAKQMLFGSAKKYLAGRERYLVDDRDKNLEAFSEAGGTAICVPRLWNHAFRHTGSVMQEVKAQFWAEDRG